MPTVGVSGPKARAKAWAASSVSRCRCCPKEGTSLSALESVPVVRKVPMTTKKQTVLVADDDPRLLKLIQRNLEIANYRVVTVSDGPSVLRQAESEEPDLYVLDIMMPGLDGREVTRRLREFSIAPVLML